MSAAGTTTLRKLLAAATCAGVLAGCVPLRVTYYAPAAEHGEVVGAHCPPVPSVVLFKIGEVVAAFRMNTESARDIATLITFEVPAGHRVELVDTFVVVESAGAPAQRLPLAGADRSMRGSTEKGRMFGQVTLYGTTDHAYYSLRARLRAEESDEFRLTPPRFRVDDVLVELPAIRFVRTSEFRLQPLNC